MYVLSLVASSNALPSPIKKASENLKQMLKKRFVKHNLLRKLRVVLVVCLLETGCSSLLSLTEGSQPLFTLQGRRLQTSHFTHSSNMLSRGLNQISFVVDVSPNLQRHQCVQMIFFSKAMCYQRTKYILITWKIAVEENYPSKIIPFYRLREINDFHSGSFEETPFAHTAAREVDVPRCEVNGHK